METRVLRYFHKPSKDYKTTVITQTTDVSTALAGKVDKSSGRGLTQNNYTTPEKNKLKGIEPEAEVNVQADWNTVDTEHDSFIKNKPTKLSQFENDSGFINEAADLSVTIGNTSYTLPQIIQNLYDDIQTLKGLWIDDGTSLVAKSGRSATAAGFYDSTVS